MRDHGPPKKKIPTQAFSFLRFNMDRDWPRGRLRGPRRGNVLCPSWKRHCGWRWGAKCSLGIATGGGIKFVCGRMAWAPLGPVGDLPVRY